MPLAPGRYVNIGGTAVDLGGGGGGGSLVSVGHALPWPPVAGTAGGTFAVSSTSRRWGWVVRMPAAGTIDAIRWRANSVTVAADVRVRLETVASTGFPTGTLIAAGAEGSLASGSLTATTLYETAIGTPPTVAAGDLVAVVIDSPSGSPNWTISQGLFSDTVSHQLTNVAKLVNFTTAWNKGQGTPVGGIKLSGAYLEGITLADVAGSTSFNTGSNPDERGIVFVQPFTCRATGLYMTASADTTAPFDLVLYDSTNTVLGTCTVSGGCYTNTSAWPFDGGPVQLDAGSTYRVTLRPTSGSNVSARTVAPGTAALAAIMGGGNTAKRTQRTNAGAWTDTDYARDLVGIVFDQVIAA